MRGQRAARATQHKLAEPVNLRTAGCRAVGAVKSCESSDTSSPPASSSLARFAPEQLQQLDVLLLSQLQPTSSSHRLASPFPSSPTLTPPRR